MSEVVNLGKVSMTAEGNYDPSRSYDKLAVVAYNGLSWVSRKKVPEGVAPSEANSAFWQKISDRGERGPEGQSYVDREMVPIVDDLTTGGSANVLSAEQGKVLKQELTELESEVSLVSPIDTETSDLEVEDSNGNMLLRVKDGEIETKNFDSRHIKTANSNASDFDICDSQHNILVRIKDGEIATKNFDSGHMKTANSNESDFDICDSQHNILARIKDGHIMLSKFNSVATASLIKNLYLLNSASESSKVVYISNIQRGVPVFMGDNISIGDYFFSLTSGRLLQYKGGESWSDVSHLLSKNDFYIDKFGNIYVWRDTMRNVKGTPIYKYCGNKNFHDYSDIISGFKLSYENRSELPNDIISRMDALVTKYPTEIEKYDVMEMDNVADEMLSYGFADYPQYAKGISEATDVTLSTGRVVTYFPTPAYKVYMYKIKRIEQGSIGAKRKLLFFSGEHANEKMAMYNSYILAKELLESNDETYAKLRSDFDIYILPILNVYGAYHAEETIPNFGGAKFGRANANYINPCRNYPNSGWELRPMEVNYGGEHPATEFETCLIMALHKVLKPHAIIDHHNYSHLNPFQFYCVTNSMILGEAMCNALMDCSTAMHKNYPTFFGDRYFPVVDDNQRYAASGIKGSYPSWANNEGYTYACILECGETINYKDGKYTEESIELYSDKTFAIAQYTLRSCLGNIIESLNSMGFINVLY